MMDFFLGDCPHEGFNLGKEVAQQKNQQDKINKKWKCKNVQSTYLLNYFEGPKCS